MTEQTAGAFEVSQLLALSRSQAKAEHVRHNLRVGWMAGIALDPVITEARREIETMTNRLHKALHRYEDAVREAGDKLRERINERRAVADNGADAREAIWQAGYKAAGEDAKVLLGDIKLRLDEDAHDERDRMDAVSEQTRDLLRRLESALLEE